MITERIDLWKPEEYSYPLAFGFKPNLRTYLHEDDEIRPAMVVVPGGAYAFVAPTEAGIIAENRLHSTPSRLREVTTPQALSPHPVRG